MRSPLQLQRAFGPSDLTNHFMLLRGSPPGWAGFEAVECRGWRLVVGASVQVRDLRDASGAHLGWLVGDLIDLGRADLVTGHLTVPPHALVSVEAFDGWLHGYGGRYAALVISPFEVVVPDGYGSVPIFYAPDAGIVASNPFLIAETTATLVESPLVEQLRVDVTGTVFAAGATPFAGIEHLLPNHVLPLADCEPRRVWPTAQIEPSSAAEQAARIGDLVAATITAAVRAGDAVCSLTAGGDTRLLLACGREVVDEMRFFTIAFPDDIGTTDVRWAPRIAERFGLAHEILPWVEPTARDLALYMYRTGAVCGERRGRRAAPSFAQLGGCGTYLAGVGGEYLKGREVPASTAKARAASAAALLRVLSLPPAPELLSRVDRWLEGLPPVTQEQRLALAQLELYDAAWGGAFPSGYPEAARTLLYPLLPRPVIEAVLSVPPAERHGDLLRTAIIHSRWPELLEVPFNRITVGVYLRRRRARYCDLVCEAFRRMGRKVRRGARHAGVANTIVLGGLLL